MVLVLVVHELEAVTATVPMCIILLKDLSLKKEIPESFKLRQVVPTSGEVSTSLWDVVDIPLFEDWLKESLGPDVSHSLHPVVEDFSIGLISAISQARTADKAKQQLVSFKTTTKSAVSKAGTQLTDFDRKYGISENTTQTFKKMSDAASQAKDRALENPTVARMSTNVNAGIKSMGKSLGWARDRLAETLIGPAPAAPGEQRPVSTAPPPATQQRADNNAVFDLGEEEEE